MNFLNTLRLIFQLLPIIHAAIDQIDDLFPEGGRGAEKLELVKGILEKAMSVSNTVGDSFTAIWPTIAGVIANLVAMKKARRVVASTVTA